MYFNELRFFAFFALVFAVHWALRRNGARKNWLLLTSYAFYAAWDWRFLGLILLSTVVDFAVGLQLGREALGTGARRAWLVTSLAVNLGTLGLFKYYDFFAASAGELLQWFGFEADPRTLGLVLPVGISFYTFQTLSYTIEVYRRTLAPCRNPRDFSLFVAFFPQLVAGPIVRAKEFLPQLAERRNFWAPQYRALAWMFLFGYVKKACFADNLAPFVDAVFSAPAECSTERLWLGISAYYVQLYCDFSGYSDMAIATAGMLGYRLPLNFAFPMFANSIRVVWRRWHISLSAWFRDYLYYPLGGNRRGTARTLFNLWFVFLVCGLWHGADWNRVLWGAAHGVFLVVERVTPLQRWAEKTPLGVIYAQFLFLLALVVFRTHDLDDTQVYLAGMFAGGDALDPTPLATWTWILVLFMAGHVVAYNRSGYAWAASRSGPVKDIALGVAAALAIAFTAPDYTPFIYFQF